VALNKEPYDGTIFPLNLTIIAIADTAERLKSIQQKEKISNGSACTFVGKIEDEDAEIIVNGDAGEVVEENENAREQVNDDLTESVENCVRYKKQYKTELFTDYALKYVLIPISERRWHSAKVSSAACRLLICLIIYMYVIRFVILYDIQLIFVLICYPLFIDLVKFCKDLIGGDNARNIARNMLTRVVIHIISIAMTVSFLGIILFGACVLESIQTRESSAPATEDDMDSDVGESTQDKVLFVFNSAWRIMVASVDNLYTQWSVFKHTLTELCDVFFLRKMSQLNVSDE
jgi:hypothetical protein